MQLYKQALNLTAFDEQPRFDLPNITAETGHRAPSVTVDLVM